MNLEEHKARLDSLRAGRAVLNSHLQDVVDNLLPDTQGFTTTYQEGEKRGTEIYDPTGIHALTLFYNGLAGLFTNSATSWFAVAPEDPELAEHPEAKEYAAVVEKVFYALFAKSNFYGEIRKFYRDFGSLGTPLLFPEPHPRTFMNFTTLHLGDNHIACDRYGQVDTDYRTFNWTARQIKQAWPQDAGQQVNDALQANRPDEKLEVCQAIYPRTDRQYWSKNGLNKPWASVYFLTRDLHLLSEGGYNEFPLAIARAEVMTGETYGRSLGMIALPFIKGLNKMEEDLLAAGEKALDPALLVSKTAMIEPLVTWPSEINVVNAQNPGSVVAPLPSGNLPYALEMLQRKETVVRQIFFNDLLSLIEAPNQTATEVLERAQEKLRNMGGVVGGLQVGFNILFDRMFNICLEEGYVPPPPRVLQGKNFKIDFISPLAKAQKAYEMDGIRRGLAGLAQIGQFKPEVMDIANLDEVAKYLLENSAWAPKFINNDQKVKMIRQVRAQAQQQEQALALANEAAKAAPGLAKGVDPSSPLGLLMAPGEQMQ